MTHHHGPAADPTPKANTSYPGPLAGVRVLEFAGIGPGPMAGMVLADLGAEIVTIDRPGGAGPFDMPLLKRGRRSICLDLKSDEGRAVVLDLVEHSDLLIEPYRPGVMERFGIGPDVCLARNPSLIFGRMTGWGQTGPQSMFAGHDLNYVAISGVLSTVVRNHRASSPEPVDDDPRAPRPVMPGPYLGDVAGGALLMVIGLLAALHERRATGVGQVVDAAIVDGTSYLSTFTHALIQAGQWDGAPGRNVFDGGAPFYEVYECADGTHLAVGPLEPQFYVELLRRLGLDLPEDDPRHPSRQFDETYWPAAKALWEKHFRTRTRDEWCDLLERSDACVAPVLDIRDAIRHPHLVARAGYRDVGGIPTPTPAPRLARTVDTPRPPEPAGTSTDDVLTSIGYAAARIAELRATGVIR